MNLFWQKFKTVPKSKILWVWLILLSPIYFFLPAQSLDKFYSPDETAAYYFTQNFAKNNVLKIHEPLNEFGANIVFPRSINVNEKHELVSGSFVGLPILYGLLAKLFSIKTIIFFTPLFSLLAVWLFFLALKNLLNEKTAFWSAFFLAVYPIFIYSANKGLLQQNLQMFFLISAFYFLSLAWKKNQDGWLLISGLLVSLSLFIRTSEIFFLAGLIFFVWLLYPRKKRFLIFFSPLFLLGCFGILLINKNIYGQWLAVGYQSLENTGHNQLSLWKKIINVFLPFGHDLSTVFIHTNEYLWKMFFPLIASSIFGLVVFCKNSWQNKLKFFAGIIFIFTLLYEIIFYGSFSPWGLSGIPNELQNSIGAPHLRYFQLLATILIPWAVWFWQIFWQNEKNFLRIFLTTLFVFFALIFSFSQLFNQNSEGLNKINADLQEFSIRLDKVKNYAPPNSLLIVPEWADRIFFPEYKILQAINDPKVHAQDPILFLPKILTQTSIFYYSSENKNDIGAFEKKLAEQKIDLRFLADIFKDEKLYVLQQNQ